MTAGVKRKETPTLQFQFILPINPHCFYRIKSLTKCIEVRPTDSLPPDLKIGRIVSFYNEQNTQEIQKCRVVHMERFASFDQLCRDKPEQISHIYPGITSAAYARNLYPHPEVPVTAIHFEANVIFKYDPITPPIPQEKKTEPKKRKCG